MTALLKIHWDGKLIETFELREAATVGRGEGCGIRLEDHAVSRSHAILEPDASGKVIQFRKKSEFGWIKHNGVEQESGAASPGDMIEIGPFQIEFSGDEAAVESESPSTFSSAVPIESFAPVAPAVDFPASQESEAVASESPLSMETPEVAVPVEGGMELGGDLLEQGDAAVPSAPPLEKTAVFDPDGATRLTPMGRVTARLVFASGSAAVEQFDFNGQEKVVIGRGKKCDIILQDKKSSR